MQVLLLGPGVIVEIRCRPRPVGPVWWGAISARASEAIGGREDVGLQPVVVCLSRPHVFLVVGGGLWCIDGGGVLDEKHLLLVGGEARTPMGGGGGVGSVEYHGTGATVQRQGHVAQGQNGAPPQFRQP